MAELKDFEKIAMPHLDAVFRTALVLCGDRAQADDLAQTTFLKAFEKFSTFTPGTSCKAWLMRILRNTWIDQLRHGKVVPGTVPLVENIAARPGLSDRAGWSNPQEILEKFSDQQVIRALRDLPEDQRMSLLLMDVEGLSQDEVAAATGVAVGTVLILGLTVGL